MLQKKHLNKRRIRNTLPKIFFLFLIFVCTSGILFLWFFWHEAQKIPFITPITTAQRTASKKTIVGPDDTTVITELLKQNNLVSTSVLPASNSGILVTLDSGEQIMFSQNKDLSQQIASLQLIRRQLTIEGKRLIRVDFRFDNPVISF